MASQRPEMGFLLDFAHHLLLSVHILICLQSLVLVLQAALLRRTRNVLKCRIAEVHIAVIIDRLRVIQSLVCDINHFREVSLSLLALARASALFLRQAFPLAAISVVRSCVAWVVVQQKALDA